MKRTSTITVDFEDNNDTCAIATVTTFTKKNTLTREESELQHDSVVDDVVAAIRTLHYAGRAPLRNVRIR